MPAATPAGHRNPVSEGRRAPGSGALLIRELMVTGAIIVLGSGGAKRRLRFRAPSRRACAPPTLIVSAT